MEQEYDEATAYHEAGHAVIPLALGRPAQQISVLPDRDSLGQYEFGKNVFRPSEDWLEREILIALGGIAAEAVYTGRYAWDGASRDEEYVRRLCIRRAGERRAEPASGGRSRSSAACWRGPSTSSPAPSTGGRLS